MHRRGKSAVIGHDCNDHIRDTAATKNTRSRQPPLLDARSLFRDKKRVSRKQIESLSSDGTDSV